MVSPKIDINTIKESMIKSKLKRFCELREKVALDQIFIKDKKTFFDFEIAILSENGELLSSDTAQYNEKDKLIKHVFNKTFFSDKHDLSHAINKGDIYPRSFFDFNTDNKWIQFHTINCNLIEWDIASREYYPEKLKAEGQTENSSMQAMIRLSFSAKRYDEYINNFLQEQESAFNELIHIIETKSEVKKEMLNFIFKKTDINFKIFEEISIHSKNMPVLSMFEKVKEEKLKILNAIIEYIKKVEVKC